MTANPQISSKGVHKNVMNAPSVFLEGSSNKPAKVNVDELKKWGREEETCLLEGQKNSIWLKYL